MVGMLRPLRPIVTNAYSYPVDLLQGLTFPYLLSHLPLVINFCLCHFISQRNNLLEKSLVKKIFITSNCAIFSTYNLEVGFKFLIKVLY